MTKSIPTDAEPSSFPASPEPCAAQSDEIAAQEKSVQPTAVELSTPQLASMIALSALAMVSTLPGRTHGLGLITEGLLQDLALDRLDYARINLFATLIGSTFCWPCGWLLDRLGMRLTGAAVLVLLGISTFGIALANSVAALWLWITLTRGFGQSMLSVVSITLAGKSSVGPRQSMAMAGYSLLVSLNFIAVFSLLGSVIPAAGWQTAWLGVGATVLLAGPVFGLCVVEPCGQSRQPGGDTQHTGSSATFTQAIQSPGFWVFALTSAFYAFVSAGLSLFNQSILAERHFDASVFYSLLSITTLAGLISNLVSGWLARRVSYGRLMAVAMTVYTLALLAFPFVTNLVEVYTYGVAIGLCGGVVTVVFFGVWSHAYGRDHLGKIQGVAQAATVLASAAGPLAFAECHQRFGSYAPAFWTIAACVACLAIAAWIVPTPHALPGRWPNETI